jgi:hypothetical protein
LHVHAKNIWLLPKGGSRFYIYVTIGVFMAEPAKRDPRAPKFLEISIKDSDGKVWSTIYAQAKEFSTGSVGYYASEKTTNPESGERYQCGLSFTLIGSKPGK